MTALNALKIIPLLAYGWFLSRFYIRLLEPRYSKRLTGFIFVAYALIVDNYIISRYLPDFTSASLLTHIGVILLILLLFKGDIVKKIAVGVIGYAIYNLSAYLIVIPLFLADGAGFSEPVLTLIERSRFAAAVFLLELISRKCTRFGGALPRKSSATLLFPVLFVVFANEFVYFAYQSIHITPLIVMAQGRGVLPSHYFTDALAVLLTAAFGLAVLLIAVFANNAMLESRLREQHLNLQVEHYVTLERKSRLFASLRHDMKNHILSLKGLISRGETGEAARYLERMSESAAMAEPVISTGNSAVDAVLNEKHRQATEDNIDFQCDVRIPGSARLDSFDLCVILGNSADNAIEACRKCNSKRFVHIKSGTVKSFLVLEIRNSTVLQELLTETNKTDWEFHSRGTGLKNIRTVTELNGGVMDTALENGVFVLSVLLPF